MRYQPRHRAPRAYHRRLVLLLTVASLVVLASVVGIVSQAQAATHGYTPGQAKGPGYHQPVVPHVLGRVLSAKDDGSPGCVSHNEWDAVKPVDANHFMPVAWVRQTMNQHFGTIPYHVQGPYPIDDALVGTGTGLTSSYDACWSATAIVSVDFAKTDVVPFREAYRSYDGLVF